LKPPSWSNSLIRFGDILATMADIVQPRSFDELVKYGLDDARATPPAATPS
jgi:hypothetical protein